MALLHTPPVKALEALECAAHPRHPSDAASEAREASECAPCVRDLSMPGPYVLSVWGQLFFMLESKIEACKLPRNDLKSCQRHRNDLSV